MRNRYILLADLFFITCAVLTAYVLRFDWRFFETRHEVWPFLIAAILTKPFVFGACGMYRRYWPYASTNELIVVAGSNALASMVLAVLVPVGIAVNLIDQFPRTIILIDLLLCLSFTGGIRFFVRVAAETHNRARKVSSARSRGRRLLIVGAGEAGALVARESRRNPQLGFEIVGFLDDDRTKQGKRIAGERVIGPIKSLEHAIRTYKVDEVAIAMPTAPGAVIRDLLETCRHMHVPSKTVPGVYELLGDRVSVSKLRNVQIEDLLRRNPVAASDTVAAGLADRVVLVTGAGGSIGSELCRQVARAHPRSLIVLGHGENSIFDIERELMFLSSGLTIVPVIADIRDGRRMRDVFLQYRPNVVFHAAAHKHVPLMEANPDEAVTNNVLGTARVAKAAMDAGADRFVLISSDKAVSPTSTMGASKRLAEEYVRAVSRGHAGSFVVVRFGNVLGSRGSVVPLFQKQIERGGPITITHPDMRRFFMTIPEAVHLVLQAGTFGRGGEVFVLNMGALVPVVDMARDLIRLSGLEPDDIPIVYTGIRPGEKLVEELWEEDAQIEGTRHPDVFRVVERERSDVQSWLPDIAAAVAARDWAPPDMVARLRAACQQMIADVSASETRGHLR